MSLDTAELIVSGLACYGLLGFGFAVIFVVRGVAAIDPAARDMPSLVRLLIVPGVTALWPLMLWKWMTQKAPPVS